MKAINYWKVAGLTVITIIVLYVIYYLIAPYSSFDSIYILHTTIFSGGIFVLGLYSFGKMRSAKEFIYMIVAFSIVGFFQIPLITLIASLIYIGFCLGRLEKNKVSEGI